MKLPLVSIVVPVYNAEVYVAETIESLLAQSYKNLEIIAIDDGSNDKSYEILQKYAGKIKFETQKNCGQSETLRRGWSLSQGEIIGYLSADDTLHVDCILSLVEELVSKNEMGAVYPDYNLMDANSKIIRRVFAPNFDYLKVVKNLECPPGPGLLFRKKYFDEFGGWNPNLRQTPDFEYWLRIGQVCQFMRHPNCLANFRIHNESQSFAHASEQKAEEPVLVMSNYFKNVSPSHPAFDLKAKSLASAHLLTARLHLRSARWEMGFTHIIQSFLYDYITPFEYRSLRIITSGLFGRAYYKCISIWFFIFNHKNQ